MADVTAAAGYDEASAGDIFGAIDTLRIPIAYLANLFTAGRVAPVRQALRRLAMVRTVMRAHQLGLHPAVDPADVGLSEGDAEDLFRLLAIARYEDRYVVPPAHAEDAGRLMAQHSMTCSLETDGGPGMGGAGPEPGAAGASSGVSGFHLRRRGQADAVSSQLVDQPAGPPGDQAADQPSDAPVVGRDRRGRLHLRVSEGPPPGPAPGASGPATLGGTG